MPEKNEKKPMSFVKFLTQFNVVGLAIGIIMGSGAEQIANKIIESIVMPFIHPLLIKITGENGDGTKLNLWGGKKDGGVTVDFEPVIEIFIKFGVLCTLIYLLLRSGAKMALPTKNVKLIDIGPSLKKALRL
jgi:large-conductance mechanosensitive channel